jgi:hypothetical protein
MNSASSPHLTPPEDNSAASILPYIAHSQSSRNFSFSSPQFSLNKSKSYIDNITCTNRLNYIILVYSPPIPAFEVDITIFVLKLEYIDSSFSHLITSQDAWSS